MRKKEKENMIYNGRFGFYREKVKCDFKICFFFLELNIILLYLSLFLVVFGFYILSVFDWDFVIIKFFLLLNLIYFIGFVWFDKVCKWYKRFNIKIFLYNYMELNNFIFFYLKDSKL